MQLGHMSLGVNPASARLANPDASGTSCSAVSRNNHRRRHHIHDSSSVEPAEAGCGVRSSDSSHRLQSRVLRMGTSVADAARVDGSRFSSLRAAQVGSCVSLQAASFTRSVRTPLQQRSQLRLCRSWSLNHPGPSFLVHRPMMLACPIRPAARASHQAGSRWSRTRCRDIPSPQVPATSSLSFRSAHGCGPAWTTVNRAMRQFQSRSVVSEACEPDTCAAAQGDLGEGVVPETEPGRGRFHQVGMPHSTGRIGGQDCDSEKVPEAEDKRVVSGMSKALVHCAVTIALAAATVAAAAGPALASGGSGSAGAAAAAAATATAAGACAAGVTAAAAAAAATAATAGAGAGAATGAGVAGAAAGGTIGGGLGAAAAGLAGGGPLLLPAVSGGASRPFFALSAAASTVILQLLRL